MYDIRLRRITVAHIGDVADINCCAVDSLDRQIAQVINQVAERSDLLALIQSGQLKFAPVIPRDVTVRLHGNTAIVTGRTDMRGSFEDTPFATASRYTHIYVHRNDGWNLAGAQGTMILEDTA